jgi:transposase
VEQSRVEKVVARGLSVRAAAKELEVSPSSYLRLMQV